MLRRLPAMAHACLDSLPRPGPPPGRSEASRMILECPECHNRHLIPDHAIGPGGRAVRCANCGHAWFQEGAEVAPPPVADAAATEPEPPLPEPSSQLPSPRPPSEPPPAIEPFPETEPEGYDAGAQQPPPAPKREGTRRWAILAIAAALLLIAGAGLVLWPGAPGLLQRLGVPTARAQSPLRLVDNPIERRDLTNGSELFAVSGKVLNPSGARQRVPNIRADLRDASGRIVFSWTITPQRRTIGPGSAIDFNSAKLDVPASSKRLELSFAGEKGG